jgi:cytochrome P450
MPWATPPLTAAMLPALSLAQTEMVLKKALRLVPPVAIILRSALRGFDWNGIHIPAGSAVSANVTMIMGAPRLFTDPERFDPEPFSEARAEDHSHRFASTLFGGGAHKCIGLHFSTMHKGIHPRAAVPLQGRSDQRGPRRLQTPCRSRSQRAVCPFA